MEMLNEKLEIKKKLLWLFFIYFKNIAKQNIILSSLANKLLIDVSE
jgi:hypothetical protein